MRVRCIATTLKTEVAERLAPVWGTKQHWDVTIGEVLGVYGLSFVRGVVFVDIEASGGWFLAPVPVQLFEVIDGTIPGGWVAKLHDDGALTLWPASFYTEYYHERLAHFDAEIVEDFLRVREELGFEPRS